MTDVGIGVIGLGLMGRVHAANAVDLGGRVVAGVDVEKGPRTEFATEYDVPTYGAVDEMLESETIDAVIITTPNKFHEPAAVTALEEGCHVFIEKPLAHTLRAAQRIAKTARTSPGFCMVGFHSRFSPATIATRGYRDAGRFGDICHVEATFIRRRGIPAHGSWFTNAELSGGGALIDVGVHVIDLALYLLDFPTVEEITGVTRTNFGPRDDYADPEGFAARWTGGNGTFNVEDSVSAFIRCADDRTISLEVAWATNRPPANELIIRGNEAGAKFELEGEMVELYETGNVGVDHYVTTEIDARGGPDGHLKEMECFLNGVLGDTPPRMNSVEEALVVQEIIDAVYRSSKQGKACSLQTPRRVAD